MQNSLVKFKYLMTQQKDSQKQIGYILEYQNLKNKIKAFKVNKVRTGNGAPGEIRTPDQVVRSHLLYPAELRARKVLTRLS